MDKLDKCYYWHIITLAKMRLRLKELNTKSELDVAKHTSSNKYINIYSYSNIIANLFRKIKF